MLHEICPVQFIEGMNEGEKWDYKRSIPLKSFGTVAIAYSPTADYCLTKVSICFGHNLQPNDSNPMRIILYSEYKDNPSDILLAEGESYITNYNAGTPVRCWQEAELTPVVVTRRNKYWLSIVPNDVDIHLLTATDGTDTPIYYYANNEWSPSVDFDDWKCMVKFYGRMLPAIG